MMIILIMVIIIVVVIMIMIMIVISFVCLHFYFSFVSSSSCFVVGKHVDRANIQHGGDAPGGDGRDHLRVVGRQRRREFELGESVHAAMHDRFEFVDRELDGT